MQHGIHHDLQPDDATQRAVALLAFHGLDVVIGFIGAHWFTRSLDAPVEPFLTETVVTTALGTAGDRTDCVASVQNATIQIVVLGYLRPTGPNLSSVPPNFGQRFGDVPPPGIAPNAPTRVLDTREGIGAPATKVSPGAVAMIDLRDRIGPTTTAVVLNVTATETEAPGFVTAYPCDVAMPTASNLNYERGLTVPNLVTVPISADGRMCLFTRAAAHLVVVDAEAWFGPAGAAGYEALTPTRALDTRVSITEAPYGIGTVAKIAAGLHVPLSLHDRFGVPSDATAVVLNVTVTDPNAAGYLTVYPCDQPRPTASNLNYERNQTVANQVTVALSTNLAVIAPGTVCLFTQQTTNLVVDVAGYYTTTPEQNWAVELT